MEKDNQIISTDLGRKRKRQHLVLIISFFFVLIFGYIATQYTSARTAAIISIAVIIYMFATIVITTFWDLPGYTEKDKRIVKYGNWEEGIFFLALLVMMGMSFFEPLWSVQIFSIMLTVSMFPGVIILFLHKDKAVRKRVTSHYEISYITKRPDVINYITAFIILIGFSNVAYVLARISSYHFLLISMFTIFFSIIIGLCQKIESIILFDWGMMPRRFSGPKPIVTFEKMNLAYFIYLLRIPIAIVLYIIWMI